MKHNKIKGKVVIVAGGSGGIGNEICTLFATKGAQTIIAGRSSTHSTKLQNDLEPIDTIK